MGDNSETRRREGGHTIQHRCARAWRQWERMVSNGGPGRQDLEKAGTPFKKGKQEGRWETMGRQGETGGDKTLGRRTQHPTQTHFVGRQSETRGNKTSGRRTHHPTQAHMWGDSGRQWQTRERPEKADIPSQAHMWGDNGRQKGKTTRREGGPTIQHRQTCGETMRDNARQCAQWDRRGEKERQYLGKADTPSNTGTHAERQWETLGDKGEARHRERKHIIQHRHTCGDETTFKGGDKVPGRRTRQPTKRKHEGRHWVGDKGRQDQGEHLKNALRTPRAVHCLEDKKGDNVERRGTRCLGRRTHQPTKGNKKGYSAQAETEGDKTLGPRQRETTRGAMQEKGRQDPRAGGSTIQQGKSRRGTMGDNQRH